MLNLTFATALLWLTLQWNEIVVGDLQQLNIHYHNIVQYFFCGSYAVAQLNLAEAAQLFGDKLHGANFCKQSIRVHHQANADLPLNIPNYILARP